MELDDRGFIKVDDYQNTSAKGVYALGDVAGKAFLTPVALAAGQCQTHPTPVLRGSVCARPPPPPPLARPTCAACLYTQ